MVSPMKYVSPTPKYISADAYGDGGPHGELQGAVGRRVINTVSPHKMLMQDFASGQANMAMPFGRSFLDSHENHPRIFPSLRCDENMMHQQRGNPPFHSPCPDITGKFPQDHPPNLLYGAEPAISCNFDKSNKVSSGIEFLTPRKSY